MPSQIISIIIFSLALFSCDFRKSVHADLKTGIVTKGDGLSCEDVWISVDDQKIDRNTFVYGEMFLMHFSNMEGFKRENGNTFPGMYMWVMGESGDTVFKTEDLYSDYLNGINLSPLLLKANLTVGKPMHSNHKYKVFIKIWDKKDKGMFTAEMPFNIIPNDKIIIEKNNIVYDEIYLYSSDRDRAVIDGNIEFNETAYLIFEGLSGFTELNGNVFPGLKFQAVDNSKEIILDYPDLFSEYAETGINAADLKTQIYVQLKFTPGQVDNPINCETLLFDKKSKSNIKVSTSINVR
jgi:hypothetical protein